MLQLVDVIEAWMAHKAAVIIVKVSLNGDRLVEVIAKAAKRLFLSIEGLLSYILGHFSPKVKFCEKGSLFSSNVFSVM